MIAMYREDRNRNIQVWVLIIDKWMTAVFEVLFLITQELNGHWPNGQTSEVNISIKFVICLTLFSILLLHTKSHNSGNGFYFCLQVDRILSDSFSVQNLGRARTGNENIYIYIYTPVGLTE